MDYCIVAARDAPQSAVVLW